NTLLTLRRVKIVTDLSVPEHGSFALLLIGGFGECVKNRKCHRCLVWIRPVLVLRFYGLDLERWKSLTTLSSLTKACRSKPGPGAWRLRRLRRNNCTMSHGCRSSI